MIRSSPAAFSPAARRSRPIPLVVSEMSGRGSSAAVAAMMSARSGRSSGSPPVNLTSRMPSVSTPIVINRMISSPVSTSGVGSQSRPSGGMQYAQRRLQRSVSETRRSVATRPYASVSIHPAYVPKVMKRNKGTDVPGVLAQRK